LLPLNYAIASSQVPPNRLDRLGRRSVKNLLKNEKLLPPEWFKARQMPQKGPRWDSNQGHSVGGRAKVRTVYSRCEFAAITACGRQNAAVTMFMFAK
jgi:hypothetical protein